MMPSHVTLTMALVLATAIAFAADPPPTKPQQTQAPAAAAKPTTKTSAFAAAANAAATKPVAAPATDSELVTNVVGSQEAPTIMNVVPWKDKEVKLDKKSPTTNILNQVLQPLDRDVLRREVQYFRSLQDQKIQ